MAWIESHQELARHPKTRKLARKLGITVPAAIGHLHIFWWWAMDFAQDGDLSKFEPEDIADAACWDGIGTDFVNSLCDSGFIDLVEDGFIIHDWHDYVGKLLDKRAIDAERKRKSRKKDDDVQDTSEGHPKDIHVTAQVTVPNHTLPKDISSGNHSPANCFGMYEREIGELTHSVSQKLIDLEDFYSEAWLKKAIEVAVFAEEKKLRYIEGTLKNWKVTGHPEPWTLEKQQEPAKNNVRQFNRGHTGRKPSIPFVTNVPKAVPLSNERREAMRQKAALLDGDP